MLALRYGLLGDDEPLSAVVHACGGFAEGDLAVFLGCDALNAKGYRARIYTTT
jgi:hypothetical protein